MRIPKSWYPNGQHAKLLSHAQANDGKACASQRTGTQMATAQCRKTMQKQMIHS